MGRIEKALGFVIRSIDYGESDRIITVLSEGSGKISFIAKGARKTESRFGAALELLTLSEFIYYDREGLKMLKGADIIEPYSELKCDYERLSCALRCARWMQRLLEEGHAEERVFMLFKQLLEALSSEEGTLALYEVAFKLKLLEGLGLAPTLDRCAVCGRIPKRSWFSMDKGGLICERCHGEGREQPLDGGTARGLYMAQRLPFQKLKRLRLTAEAAEVGERLIDKFTAHHLRPPASARRPRRGG